MKCGYVFVYGFALLLVILVGCTAPEESASCPFLAGGASTTPTPVVQHYFESWDKHDYPMMYALMSDGFKQLEPTALTEEKFASYARSQGIERVDIISVTETSNDGTTATVDYSVEFVTKSKKVPFAGTFTVKLRANDQQPGWKLIHPYGEHIDIS